MRRQYFIVLPHDDTVWYHRRWRQRVLGGGQWFRREICICYVGRKTRPVWTEDDTLTLVFDRTINATKMEEGIAENTRKFSSPPHAHTQNSLRTGTVRQQKTIVDIVILIPPLVDSQTCEYSLGRSLSSC